MVLPVGAVVNQHASGRRRQATGLVPVGLLLSPFVMVAKTSPERDRRQRRPLQVLVLEDVVAGDQRDDQPQQEVADNRDSTVLGRQGGVGTLGTGLCYFECPT